MNSAACSAKTVKDTGIEPDNFGGALYAADLALGNKEKARGTNVEFLKGTIESALP